MELDASACYRALRTRDARFDGRFFVAVRSTGVYCRPICPARTPKRENCTFVSCAAAAQDAGYRPCLRCRPEASPGTPAWLGTSATVSRALRLITEGALDSGSIEELAVRLGVGDRHLRRLFLKHLGASPISIAQTRRVLFATKLIDETSLPMTEVAFASGFSSVRRFNAAIRDATGRAPGDLRKSRSRKNGASVSDLTLKLAFRPPFDWTAIARYLAARATRGIETVDDSGYRRTVRIDGAQGTIEVRPVAGENHLTARIRLSSPAVLAEVAERLRQLFDLGADPEAISCHLGRDRRLGRAIAARPGVRVPGAWDGFELCVRAILGQQISVKGANTLAARLVERHGEPLDPPPGADSTNEDTPGLDRLFPTPERLAKTDLRSLGLPGRRAGTISRLASAVASGELVLDGSRSLGETVESLCALPGIGDWTAQYIAMRALREPDAFPAEDLGLRRALAPRRGPVSRAELIEIAEAWRPWRAYAAMLLWMRPIQSKRRESHGTTNR